MSNYCKKCGICLNTGLNHSLIARIARLVSVQENELSDAIERAEIQETHAKAQEGIGFYHPVSDEGHIFQAIRDGYLGKSI